MISRACFTWGLIFGCNLVLIVRRMLFTTDDKLKAIDVLLLSFANAATLLNPHGTRVTLLYSMEFDPSGNLLGMTIRVSII